MSAPPEEGGEGGWVVAGAKKKKEKQQQQQQQPQQQQSQQLQRRPKAAIRIVRPKPAVASASASEGVASSSSAQQQQQQPQQQPAPAPKRAAPVSWAALVGTQPAGSSAAIGFGVAAAAAAQQPPVEAAASTAAPLPKDMQLLPRGIANAGNSCFVGSVLQAVLACPPARELFASSSSSSSSPLLAALRRLLGEFAAPAAAATIRRQGLGTSVPLRPPAYLYDLLLPHFARNEQHDAQELYSFMLDTLHTECLRSGGAAPAPAPASADDGGGEWMVVEKGGKRAARVVTQGDEFGESEVSRVFFGRMRTRLVRTGASRSVSAQPFSCLHLDIAPHGVRSVSDALKRLFSRETLDDPTAQQANVTCSIVEPLPRVLCLHLKRFAFSAESGSAEKLSKHVAFGLSLALADTSFKLVAVVRHHGEAAGRGHYTADVLHNGKRWLTTDDSRIFWTPRGEAGALRPDDAYLLFYCR